MTPEEYKHELERLARGHLDPDTAAVEFVKLRLRDGDKNLAKALKTEIDRLGLPEPWYHRWPDGVAKWFGRHDNLAFVAIIVLVIGGVISLFVFGDRVMNRRKDQREAVEAGRAEWYWSPDGEKSFRLIDPPAAPEEGLSDAR